MAFAMNKVLIVGNLTKDPLLKTLPNGTPKAEMRIAATRTFMSDGKRREETCFVDVIAWSRTAENVAKFLKRGAKVFIEGFLDYQEWTGKDGQRRSRHAVVAERVQFLSPFKNPNAPQDNSVPKDNEPEAAPVGVDSGFDGAVNL